jgi:flagellar P-ring protein precursor FlgI
LLRNPDFNTATEIANAVNASFHKPVASALDSSRVDINVADASEQSVPLLIARVQYLVISVHTPAKILINERTGTIVMGGDVKLSPVSVIHGNLSIEVVTSYTPIQPIGGGFGPPALVPQTTVNVSDGPAQSMKLEEGANVDELVNGLHSIGLSAHDVVSILQAIKAEGGLQAELEVQ